MNKINPGEFYSAMQVKDLLGFKARQTVIKYIDSGQLLATVINKDGGAAKRYAVRGDHILTFKDKYDKGLIKAEKYSVEEVRMILNRALEYCKANNIETLEAFITSVKKLK